MKIIDGVHVLSFAEWTQVPAVKEMEANFEDCSECDGDGEHECDCGDIHDCHACGGSGKVEALEKVYQKELQKELQSLLNWKNGIAKKVIDTGIKNYDLNHGASDRQ